MTMILGVISGKGGTGKTTTSINLATALSERGYKVFVVDGNLTSPNVSLHLGIPLYPVTLHDVLRGDAGIEEAIYRHPSGVGIVPASLSIEDLKDVNLDNFKKTISQLTTKSGIVLVDGSAGLGRETRAVIDVSDAVLIVTNPELPAVTDALKAIKIAKKMRRSVMGVIINRRKGMSHEMTRHDILDMLETPILGTIYEDVNVSRAIASKMPVVRFAPRSKSSQCFHRLASNLLGEPYVDKEPTFIDAIMHWIRG